MTRNPLKKKKDLKLFGLLMMGLSGAIGFEIFVLLDYAYFNLAGSGIFLALGLAAAINILIMLSYSELSTAIPEVGGEYTYIKNAYGGYVAFISGCFRWIASIFGGALAAVTFAIQMGYLFSIIIPQVQEIFYTQTWIIAVLIVLIYGAFEIKGVKRLGDLIVLLLIALFIILIVGGLVLGPGQQSVTPKQVLPGFEGIFAATVYIFPMFFGMRALIASAPTAKNPDKDIPRGLLLSALIIIPLYIGLAYVATTAAPVEGAQNQPLLSYAATRIFGDFGGVLFAIAGMGASLSALGTSLIVQSSVARGMSRDKYLPKVLQSVHRKFGTHYVALISGIVFMTVLSALGAVPVLAYAVSFGSLLVFALVNLALIKLRHKKPYLDRPFKVPLYPLIPVAGVILSISLLFMPMITGDVNAGDATFSAIGLVAVVISTYYLRMIGQHRLQIGLGGVSLGVGVLSIALSLLSELAIINPIIPFISNYIMIFVGIIFIMAGYFNIFEGRKRE